MDEQLNLNKLPDILKGKINAGIDRLENLPVDTPAYAQTLNNIEHSLSLLVRLTVEPTPKQRQRPNQIPDPNEPN